MERIFSILLFFVFANISCQAQLSNLVKLIGTNKDKYSQSTTRNINKGNIRKKLSDADIADSVCMYNVDINTYVDYGTSQNARNRKMESLTININGNIKGIASKEIKICMDIYDWKALVELNADEPLHFEKTIPLINAKSFGHNFILYSDHLYNKKYPSNCFAISCYVVCDNMLINNIDDNKEKSPYSAVKYLKLEKKPNNLLCIGTIQKEAIEIAQKNRIAWDFFIKKRNSIEDFEKILNRNNNFYHPDVHYSTDACDECDHTGVCPRCEGKKSFTTTVACKHCNGGVVIGLLVKKCVFCGGTGKFEQHSFCPRCVGTGLCNYCKWEEINRTLSERDKDKAKKFKAVFEGFMTEEEIHYLNCKISSTL